MKSSATKGNRIQPNTTKYKEMQANTIQWNQMYQTQPNTTKCNPM